MKPKATASASYVRVGVERGRELLTCADTLVLDVRDAQSFAAAHIDSAQHIVGSDSERLLAHTPRTTPILIYCYHGNASGFYAQIFADFGFPKVYSLDGGYEAWRAALTP